MSITLKPMQESDLPFVKEIYDYYTLNTTFVYFLDPITIQELQAFIPIGNERYRSFIVNSDEGIPCGFCYFSKFRPRPAFNISVEITLYLKPECTGRGYGQQIMDAIEPLISNAGFKNIMALVAGENKASIRLFERNGYVCNANLPGVAEKFGRRLPLMMFQKVLDSE